jgi:hypothetical protein
MQHGDLTGLRRATTGNAPKGLYQQPLPGRVAGSCAAGAGQRPGEERTIVSFFDAGGAHDGHSGMKHLFGDETGQT